MCPNKIRNISLFIVLMALGALLSACGGDNPTKSAQKFIDEVKQRPTPNVEPVPDVPQRQTIKYSAQNMRSPFTPQENTPVTSGLSPDMNRPKEDLETFPLDSLRMVGTLSQDNRTWALISAPDKTIYKVTIGSHIGQNYGKIIKIDKNRIDIVETIPDGLGGWKERDAYLSLTE